MKKVNSADPRKQCSKLENVMKPDMIQACKEDHHHYDLPHILPTVEARNDN